MLVDIFLLILSSGVPATRLNAQFNYVSMPYAINSMYVSTYAASFAPCCACVGELLLHDIIVVGCDLNDEMLRTSTTIS